MQRTFPKKVAPGWEAQTHSIPTGIEIVLRCVKSFLYRPVFFVERIGGHVVIFLSVPMPPRLTTLTANVGTGIVSDNLSDLEPVSSAQANANTEVRAAEAAAIRRRWITLGEILAVIAIVISALTLWNSWSERSDSKAAKSADAQQASARAATLVLTAKGGDRTLALKPADEEQSVQSQKILFPTALDAAPAETTGEPRIEAGWFENALKKARESAHLSDNSRGDERLPVVITTQFLADGVQHEDVALYDIGYTISGRLLAGHSVKLRGLSFVSRIKSGDGQDRLDGRWSKLFTVK